MATEKSIDESLVERGEVLFPKSDVIDAEPLYDNFTAIENNLRQQANQVIHQRSQSSDARYRAVRAQIESSSVRHAHSSDQLTANTHNVPIYIQSKKVNGYIFNLAQIVQDIGCQQDTPFMRSSADANTKNVSALLNVVLKMGGAHGPLVNVWRSRIDEDYFQRWYLEKYYQRSASLTQYGAEKRTAQNTRARDYQSSLLINNVPPPANPMASQSQYETEIQKMYGCDDGDLTTASSMSSQSSMMEANPPFEQRRPASITSILKKPNMNSNNNNRNTPTKHHVTIVDHQATDESDHSMSSQEMLLDNNQVLPDYQQYENIPADYQQYANISSPYQHVPNTASSPYEPVQTLLSDVQSECENNENINLSEYQQVLQNHPDAHNDPNPEILSKPNPGQEVTYEQNISLRYLIPPTPPPPGPLIIREIVPPREPTPPPLIVKIQDPSPPTPPPLVLREAPPPPPPHQETTVITKVLAVQTPPARRVIYEHCPPLPPKPQSIIIEKWLPYKPPPPREVIVQRITEPRPRQDCELGYTMSERQRRHSAECTCDPPRVPVLGHIPRQKSFDQLATEQTMEHFTECTCDPPRVPVLGHIPRQKSFDQLATEQGMEHSSGTFDQVVWSTHQQILAMQQRGLEQVQATQQWAANQWQQHANMFLNYPPHLAAPTIAMRHPPMTPNMGGYLQTEEIREQRVHYHTGYFYPYH